MIQFIEPLRTNGVNIYILYFIFYFFRSSTAAFINTQHLFDAFLLRFWRVSSGFRWSASEGSTRRWERSTSCSPTCRITACSERLACSTWTLSNDGRFLIYHIYHLFLSAAFVFLFINLFNLRAFLTFFLQKQTIFILNFDWLVNDVFIDQDVLIPKDCGVDYLSFADSYERFFFSI